MKLDIVKIAKDVFKDKELILEDVGKEKVKIDYLAKRGDYNRKSFVFPKMILVNEWFMEGLGLYLGDGDFHRKEKRHTSFTSKDKDIAVCFLGFLRSYFTIKNKDITTLIVYKKGNNNLKKEWSNALNIDTQRILTKQSNRHKEETCQIQVNGIIFRKIFENVIKHIANSNFLLKSNFRRAFLKGIFAAEGSVGIQYNDGKHYINQITLSISTEEKELRKLICKSLDFETIPCRIYIDKKRNSLTINISGWDDYFKLWNIHIFDLCERKKQKFMIIAKNLDIYLKLDAKFRAEFFKSLQMTQREIAKKIDSWQANVCRTIEGKHLLRIEQIQQLLSYCSYNMKEVLDRTSLIRVGGLIELKPRS